MIGEVFLLVGWLVAVFNFGFTSSNHHPPAAILNPITILILNHILKRQQILSFEIQNGCKKMDLTPETQSEQRRDARLWTRPCVFLTH